MRVGASAWGGMRDVSPTWELPRVRAVGTGLRASRPMVITRSGSVRWQRILLSCAAHAAVLTAAVILVYETVPPEPLPAVSTFALVYAPAEIGNCRIAAADSRSSACAGATTTGTARGANAADRRTRDPATARAVAGHRASARGSIGRDGATHRRARAHAAAAGTTAAPARAAPRSCRRDATARATTAHDRSGTAGPASAASSCCRRAVCAGSAGDRNGIGPPPGLPRDRTAPRRAGAGVIAGQRIR